MWILMNPTDVLWDSPHTSPQKVIAIVLIVFTRVYLRTFAWCLPMGLRQEVLTCFWLIHLGQPQELSKEASHGPYSGEGPHKAHTH